MVASWRTAIIHQSSEARIGEWKVEVLQLPVLNYRKEDAHLSAKIELEAERAGTPVRRNGHQVTRRLPAFLEGT